MPSTWAKAQWQETLSECHRGQRLPERTIAELAEMAATPEGTLELFRELIEPLADAFSETGAAAYADLFPRLAERVSPEWRQQEMAAYLQALAATKAPDETEAVYVLSRVTIGADIAVTSVLLDAAMQRYPEAKIYFVGSAKNYALFAGRPRVQCLELPYQRTALLAERLQAGRALQQMLQERPGLILDPDSRLGQLGCLPLGDPARHLLFPSRTYGGESDFPLTILARRFAAEQFDVEARNWLQPERSNWVTPAEVAVSLGVGENPAKRLPGDFERRLIQSLLDRGYTVLLDKGAGGEETARVAALESVCRGPLYTWQGAFAPFAEAIGKAKLYVGYDSAGQHAAAALGVRAITVFAGAPNERFAQRWFPAGENETITIRPAAEDETGEQVLENLLAELR